MSDGTPEPADRLHAFASGFHATFYVYTGVTTGLFEALTEPRTIADLAGAHGLHEPYVRQFCETGLRWSLLTVAGSTADDGPTFRVADDFADVLADDGAVVVFDHVYPDDYDQYDQAPFAAGVETQWAELTWGTAVPTYDDHRSLAAAGCEEGARRTVADRFIVYEGVTS